MRLRAADFFYDYGEEAEILLQILGEGREVFNIDLITMRVYKLSIAIKIVKDQQGCALGKVRSKADSISISKRAFENTYLSLKNEIIRLIPNNENRIFLEQVERTEKNMFYFQEYIQKEINDPCFLGELQEVCRYYKKYAMKAS